ncbi:MAG: tRNA (adenosine(37)-N6)-threonylcarbamoyltransferase complex transferase subunit TsaD [Candidatus Magasanikbacteria bacterium]|nr:tRNA (adenosine(37)-N6)-threonylcarbamoyltransferase complex transferase subunit TsaD [Candidatus Magasanikbacteria bacterium]
MLILGVETSCDETSLALLKAKCGKLELQKNLIFSQIKTHAKYGGVVPEVAARAHVEKIAMMLKDVLGKKTKPDVIAVTAGPGLATALLVGVETARTLGYLWKKPVVAVNHLAGHIYANWLYSKQIAFPALCLIISGGHTELVIMKKHLKYKLIGQTRDDAAGECFDKVGKILGLPYPGGPEVAKRATQGDTKAIKFPRPMIDSPDFDFSFSGLKTAILYYTKNHFKIDSSTPLRFARNDNTKKDKIIADICASFQQACIDVIITKTIAAAKKYKVKTILLGGGVAANSELQKQLKIAITDNLPKTKYTALPVEYCGDNAAMIAAAGYFHALKKQFIPWEKINADPNWDLA